MDCDRRTAVTNLRLRWGHLAVVALLVGCAAPTPTPPPPVAATSVPAVLCDSTDEASLSHLADELDGLDGSAMPEGLRDRLGRMRERLEPLALGPDATSVRDSAAAALQDLERGVGEPGDDSESVTIAAQTLRELETLICPPT